MSDVSRQFSEVFDEHRRVLDAMRDAGAALDAIADLIIGAFRAGRRVYVFGNGGSASDAQHIAGELLGRFKLNRRALPALALTTDSSTVTAIANDLGYEQIFARQLEALLQPGDVAWALSTSGNSPNIIAAAEMARAREAQLVGFTGETGGALGPRCTHVFRAPHTQSDRIQEAHLLAYHYICERVEAAMA